MTRVLQTLAALAVLGVLAGTAVIFGGLYNVSARVGHLPGVAAILHTTFRNSVQLRAPAESAVPDLDAAGMVALGAGHFDGGCKVCHAAPGPERPAVSEYMVPAPPHITEAVGTWEAGELHWIVSEGVKMSGMPFWPATRTHDIWPVVSFMLAVQDGMDAQTYADLTYKPIAPAGAPDTLPYCAMCHGIEGRSDNPLIPRLDILPQAYLEQTLLAYANGTRDSGIMRVAASNVTEAELMELAAWFGAQAAVPGAMDEIADADLIARGAVLARQGTRDVPACVSCHGPQAGPRAVDYPRLAGQSGTYLNEQLYLWRAGARGGGPKANLMRKAAQDLSDDDIAALSAWFAALPAADQ
ncbi:c-type cytochrome [Loktanella sp. DJP18]|uniref:c-type cytochrome n=1 Tax=Loktanella sp. DJP18 TaxID=3409788 RepID=UPI003BB66E4D